jgi:arylsulfatase A-like enzyme
MKQLLRLIALVTLFCGPAFGAKSAKPNIVFITADDLNFDSLGCYGARIKGLTPHLDALAREGIRFERAYSTVAVCQPVRQTMLTGLYPHRSGSMGFFPIKPGVRTLNQQMRDAGYLLAMHGKSAHYQPRSQFVLDVADDGFARDPVRLPVHRRAQPITTAPRPPKPPPNRVKSSPSSCPPRSPQANPRRSRFGIRSPPSWASKRSP